MQECVRKAKAQGALACRTALRAVWRSSKEFPVVEVLFEDAGAVEDAVASVVLADVKDAGDVYPQLVGVVFPEVDAVSHLVAAQTLAIGFLRAIDAV